MRARGKEKLSGKEMHEVMDTANPRFWEQWKATEKRIVVDDKHVKCDYYGGIIATARPSQDSKSATV
jgi:signal recognition particle subunit SEC65